jgi:hypothetical protein
MAKKKQLAGKKTKLAKLPLTRVLASQAEEMAPWGSPSSFPPDSGRQLPLTWDQVEAGTAGSLARVYLHLVQELTDLRDRLQPAAARPFRSRPENLPAGVPPDREILRVLRQARGGLQDLHRFLSQPEANFQGSI